MPERYGMSSREAADRAARGEERAAARIISALEDGSAWGREAALLLREPSSPPRGAASPRSRLVGITGPPGAGKSSLVDRLIAASRVRGRRVGVLAVDPSSPFTGGAMLGDRIRMGSGWGDEGVFIRSLASRGILGGLSPATAAAARVLEAAGFEDLYLETAGVGQSEIEVARVADLVVVVFAPGMGDDIQAIKAGIMEIGDLFVVNKADRPGTDRTVAELREALEDRGIPVLAVSAETGEGVADLAAAIDGRYAELAASGLVAGRRSSADRWACAPPRAAKED
jgi:LAO/AO transport system kinase